MRFYIFGVLLLVFILQTGCETTPGTSGRQNLAQAAPGLDEALLVGMTKAEVLNLMGSPRSARTGVFESEEAEILQYRQRGPDEYVLEGARIESVPYYSIISSTIEYRDEPIPEQILVETDLVLDLVFVEDTLVSIDQSLRRHQHYN